MRPEFIELTYHLYRATRDPMYLHIGVRILEQYRDTFQTRCGFAGYQDVRTGQLQDRMETFALSESLKYLYLLFDAEDAAVLHGDAMRGKNWVFSTEAHPVWFDRHGAARLRRRLRRRLRSDGGGDASDGGGWAALLRRVVAKFGSARPLTPFAYPFQKTSVPAVQRFSLPVAKRDPASRFDQCEVSPWARGGALAYYRMPDLFTPDQMYAAALVRPPHMGARRDIELDRRFYDRFLLGGAAQCARVATTEIHDVFVGPYHRMKEIEVAQLRVVGPLQRDRAPRYDLWVPHFGLVRLRIEKLRCGEVDTTNTVVSAAYLARYGVRPNEVVARVLLVNGVDVDPRGVVWTLPRAGGALTVAPGRVCLEGMAVENVAVWEDAVTA